MEEPLPYRQPSLYAAIRLARMVQEVRHKLKARVLCRRERNAHLVCEAVHADSLRPQSRSRPLKPYKSGMDRKVNFTGLLQDLDEQVAKPGLPISVVAAQDKLFLQYQAVSFNTKPIKDASRILDVSTLLIERLQHARTERLWNSPEYKTIDHGECEKYLANLEHLLLCFQHAALEALLRHSLESLQHDYQHWHSYLDQQSKIYGEYFSEWASGRPPLNSTMPWNIKPSLVVLWGVCWMFYAHNDSSVSPDGGASRRGSSSAFVRQTSWPQNYGMQNQSPTTRQNSVAPVSQPHVASVNVGLGLQVTESPVTQSIYQGETGQVGHYAHTAQQPMTSQYATQGSVSTLQQSKPSTYISTANITPSSASDASFPASSPAWNQGHGSTQAYGLGHQVWQPSATTISTPTTGYSYQQGAASTTNQISQFDSGNPSASANQSYARASYGPSHFSTPYNFTTPLMPMSEHTYPSPHSEASGRENSIMPLSVPENMLVSPQRQDASYSPDDTRDSLSAGSREPPRNQYNQIYCDHHECAQAPPIFARKCEWTKHMDKHTRPYVCDQPGCEKIRGFTYSGGLLRHQREVHRKYGGPKAPRFCPHKDCKRSTGQGFSRKENLNEHLRRVHRGVGISEDDNISATASQQTSPVTAVATSSMSQPPTTAVPAMPSVSRAQPPMAPAAAAVGPIVKVDEPGESSNTGSMRKRKRPVGDVFNIEASTVETETTLREENKRLKQELAEQHQRVHMLEDLLLRSMGQAQPGQMMHPQA